MNFLVAAAVNIKPTSASRAPMATIVTRAHYDLGDINRSAVANARGKKTSRILSLVSRAFTKSSSDRRTKIYISHDNRIVIREAATVGSVFAVT